MRWRRKVVRADLESAKIDFVLSVPARAKPARRRRNRPLRKRRSSKVCRGQRRSLMQRHTRMNMRPYGPACLR